MESYNVLTGFGLIIIIVTGFSLFFANGVTNYGLSPETELFGSDLNTTYLDLTSQDSTSLEDSTFNEDDVFGNLWKSGGIILKQIGSSTKWFGAITNLAGQTGAVLPISTQIFALIIAVLLITLIGYVIAALLGR